MNTDILDNSKIFINIRTYLRFHVIITLRVGLDFLIYVLRYIKCKCSILYNISLSLNKNLKIKFLIYSYNKTMFTNN